MTRASRSSTTRKFAVHASPSAVAAGVSPCSASRAGSASAAASKRWREPIRNLLEKGKGRSYRHFQDGFTCIEEARQLRTWDALSLQILPGRKVEPIHLRLA
jgi:hypothetical protein